MPGRRERIRLTMRTTEQLTNWAGNITFHAGELHRPSTLPELQRLVAGSPRLRALGAGHSFNRIADSAGDLVSVAHLPRVMELDIAGATVKVSAGMRYGELARWLADRGHALCNLGSWPHISVAGACATGTHGSGDANGNLATAVSAIEMVTADGDVVELDRDTGRDEFRGSVVALGALGVVTRLTLDVVPAYQVRQYVYENLPGDALAEHFAEIVASAYSVSLFTDWCGPRINQVWLKRRVDERESEPPPRRWLGATLADGPRHPRAGLSAASCTEQMGVPGPWHERLPLSRFEFSPSRGAELQAEYLLPRRHAVAALAAVDRIRDRIAPVLQISEIRTVAADDLWLSPSYRRDSVAIHFTLVPDTDAVTPVIAAVEEVLAPYAARPHWGKLFCTDPAVVRGLYERMPDFVALRRRYDPTGMFRNDLLDRYLSGEDADSAVHS